MEAPYRTPPLKICCICDLDIRTQPIEIGKKCLHAECYGLLVDTIHAHERRPIWRKLMTLLDKSWRAFWVTFCAALGLLLAVALCYPLYKSIMASGQVTFCYVDSQMTKAIRPYSLKGHREWRSDSDIGDYENLDSAMKAAERIGCAVK